MPEDKKGLDNITIILMVSTAIFYDLLQIPLNIIFMGWIVTIFAFLTFYVWFKLRGLSFTTPKRAMVMGGGLFIELIPFVSILPAWTLTIIILAIDSKVKKIIPGLDIIKK